MSRSPSARDRAKRWQATLATAALAAVGPRATTAAPPAASPPAASPPAATALAAPLQAAQQRYVDLRFGAFVHFNMGTFTDEEWAKPGQDPARFNPTRLDCGQWADAFRSAGMTFAVLTAKHHDGFCLWDTRTTDYTALRGPQHSDVVRAFVDAMRSRGVRPALYFSVWDRTHGVEPGHVTPAALDYVEAQLTELLTRYGPIPILICDGWAWKTGHQQVPYQRFRELVKRLQPDCLICDHDGLTEPWDTDVVMYEEPKGVFCDPGNRYCASQDQTISRGWFWHPSTPGEPLMGRDAIVDHLAKLEPRHCNFILNCPPNRDGRLDDNVVRRLAEVGAAWRPDPGRPPLPPQPPQLEHPVTPASATASGGDAALAVDGIGDLWNAHALYETLWSPPGPPPQWVTLDLGRAYRDLSMVTYLPAQAADRQAGGQVTAYRVAASVDGTHFTPVAQGRWPADRHLKSAEFPPVTARYVRLEATDAAGGHVLANDVAAGGRLGVPTPADPTVPRNHQTGR